MTLEEPACRPNTVDVTKDLDVKSRPHIPRHSENRGRRARTDPLGFHRSVTSIPLMLVSHSLLLIL